jgi:hypothetical protein
VSLVYWNPCYNFLSAGSVIRKCCISHHLLAGMTSQKTLWGSC